MAKSLAFDIANSLLGKIASSAMQEIALAWGVESDLQKLNSNLSAIHAVLQDAEDKQAKNRQLSDWLLKLKDFMYDADDVLDEFQYEALRSRVLKSESTRRKVRNFFSCSNPLVFRFKMGHRIKVLRERLDDISVERSKFHYLTERGEESRVLHRREMTYSFVRPSDVIGRDDDKKCIIDSLFREEGDGETVSVIPIVGIGGLGKTSLAKLVFNDKMVQDHFQLKIWVCVSEDFQAIKLAKEIIKVASGANVGDYTDEQSQICLRDTLRGKRFLLILDDVWNEDWRKWVELKILLLEGTTGSKIIVTTRSPLVASITGSVRAHNLEGLSDKDCLSLFVKWAFKEGQEKQHPNLMKIGKEVVKKCKGVPLAVRTLGSLLYSKYDEHYWIAIRDNEIWKLEQKEDGILPILKFHFLTERGEESRVLHRREMTHPFVCPSDVIGRDDDKKCIIDSLFCEEGDGETISVIPIVGIGGLGKTSLAKLVYNDNMVQDHFQLKIWVCVSEDFQAIKLAKEIIKVASGANVGDYTDEQSQICLRDTLRGKRFLLILDDVWNEDRVKWVELKNLLLEGATGSKIIVTTRSPLVASIMGSVRAHNLEGLSPEDCWSLFVKWAFEEGQEKQHPNLMKIGNEVVKKCKGVPLAVRTLGRLLYSKYDEHYWIAIRDNEIWKLEQKEDDILPILKLSYEQLPSHLKLCFSYCSLFPKDHLFDNVELVQHWMSQGLIRSSDEGQELEDIGNRYINELWSRSFFQDVEELGYFNIFKMHDLVHDLALLISKDECLTMSTRTQSIPKMIRHVSFFNTDLSCEEVPSVLQDQNRLRTILFTYGNACVPSNSFVETCILRFKYMRALELVGSRFEVLHNSVGNLKHLRLLSLARNKSIKKLPKSICKLHHLQTLILAGCSELEELPKNIGKYLISLRYLAVTTKQTSLEVGCLPMSLRYLMIVRCVNLKSLGEEGMQRLTALRTLAIVECESLERLPRGLNCSTTLENLCLLGLAEIDTMEFEQDTGAGGGFAPPSLRFLQIGELPKLEALPQWLQGSAVQKLLIEDCPKLSSLPEGMNHLTELKIDECDELTDRCLPETGEDWTKIAHVPKITLDGETIKSPENED